MPYHGGLVPFSSRPRVRGSALVAWRTFSKNFREPGAYWRRQALHALSQLSLILGIRGVRPSARCWNQQQNGRGPGVGASGEGWLGVFQVLTLPWPLLPTKEAGLDICRGGGRRSQEAREPGDGCAGPSLWDCPLIVTCLPAVTLVGSWPPWLRQCQSGLRRGPGRAPPLRSACQAAFRNHPAAAWLVCKHMCFWLLLAIRQCHCSAPFKADGSLKGLGRCDVLPRGSPSRGQWLPS